MNNQEMNVGIDTGKRMICGGRSQIRTAMYMTMTPAIQCDKKKVIYQ